MTGVAPERLVASGTRRPVAWTTPWAFALSAVLLLVAAIVGWLAFERAASLGRLGADLTLYLDATRSWLGGGPFYPAWQLAPYTLVDGAILYPPTAIPLFVPFLVVPAVLWWAIPLGIIGAVVWRHRPAPWTWPLMAACLAYIPTTVKLVHGNPFMWVAALVALGTLYRWPSALVLVKPSLFPFALSGIRSRGWWVAVAVQGAVLLIALPLTMQYVSVLLNAQGSSLFYSLSDAPFVAIPLIAALRPSRPAQTPYVTATSPAARSDPAVPPA